MNFLTGYKTYIAAAAAFFAAASGYANGTIDLPSFLEVATTAIIGATIRHGITTTVASAVQPGPTVVVSSVPSDPNNLDAPK